MAPPLARDRVLGSAHLLSRVLEGLTPAELARAAAVSPLWRAAGRSPDLWRAHLLARRPAAPAAAAGVQPRLAAAAAPPWRLYAARARTLLRPRAWTLADYTCTVDVWLRGPDDGDDDDGGAEPGGGPSLSAAGRWGADGAKSHAAPGARLRLAISDSKHYLNEVEWPQFAVDVIILRSDGLAWAASSCPPDGSSCCLLQPYENAGVRHLGCCLYGLHFSLSFKHLTPP